MQKMLLHGYEGSEVPPYQYGGAVHSTTIALRSVTTLHQHAVTASQEFWVPNANN
jgi:hypothetical protein